MNKAILYFDGSCTPKNPGGIAGFAWRLVDGETNQEVAAASGEVCRGPEATNNVAEWAAVRNGVRYLVDQKFAGELEIRGDSQLVIFQLDGSYKCKKPTLQKYHVETTAMLEGMKWSARWIPREENKEADKMSRLS